MVIKPASEYPAILDMSSRGPGHILEPGTKSLTRVISVMEFHGKVDEADRLRQAGPDGYPGMDELDYYAEVLEGRIEMTGTHNPDDPLVTYGDSGPPLFPLAELCLLRG